MSYTEITTLEEAFKRHPANIDHAKVKEAISFLPKEIGDGMLAFMEGQVVTYVLNNDDPNEPVFIPDYNNTKQKKYFGWWIGGDATGSGFRFFGDGWTSTYAVAASFGGARLALKDVGRVMHAKTHFPELYKRIYLILG